MGTLSSIRVAITGNARGLNRTLKSAQAKVRSAGRSMQRVGSKMTQGVTIPLAGAGAAAVTFAAKFNSNARNVASTANLTEEQIRKMKPAVEDIATTTGESTKEIFSSFQKAVSSSLDFKEAMELTEQATKASAAGFGEADELVKAATTGMDEFTKSVSGPAEMLDQIVATGQRVQAEVPQMGRAFTVAAGAASSLGVEQNQLLGILGSVADRAEDTRIAGRQVRMLFQNLQDPSKGASENIAELFGSMDKFHKMLSKDAIGTFKKLNKRVKENGMSLNDVIGPANAVTGAQRLLADNGKLANEVMNNAKTATDSVNKAFQKSDSFTRDLSRAWQQLQKAMRPIGNEIIPLIQPMFTKLINKIGKMSKWFQNLTDKQQRFTIIAAGVAAAVGPVLVVLGTLLTTLAPLVSTFGAVSAAIVGLLATFPQLRKKLFQAKDWFVNNWDTIKKVTKTTFEALKTIVGTSIDVVITNFEQWLDVAKTVFTAIKKAVNGDIWGAMEELGDLIKRTMTRIINLFNRMERRVKGSMRNISQIWSNSSQKIMNTAKTLSLGLIGNSIITDMLNAIKRKYKSSLNFVTQKTKVETQRQKSLWKNWGMSAIETANLVMAALKSTIKIMTRHMARGLKAMLKGTKSFGEALKGVWDGIFNTIMDMISKLIAKMLVIGALSAMFPGTGGGFMHGAMGVLKNFGNFASGGRVPGRPGEPRLAIVHGGEEIKSRGEGTKAAERKLRESGGMPKKLEIGLAGEPALQALFERLVDDVRLKTGIKK